MPEEKDISSKTQKDPNFLAKVEGRWERSRSGSSEISDPNEELTLENFRFHSASLEERRVQAAEIRALVNITCRELAQERRAIVRDRFYFWFISRGLSYYGKRVVGEIVSIVGSKTEGIVGIITVMLVSSALLAFIFWA